jgi:sugar (pentulose or hexulose) kinase
MAADDDLTLVLDIGKSHAKLLMFDAAGAVVEQHGRANRSVTASLGYTALGVTELAQWITEVLSGSHLTPRCTHAIASTHGAAFVALGDDDDAPAWDPIDYELDDGNAALRSAYQSERDEFAATLAPDLPAGLNAARQLHWMQHTHPAAWARTRCLLPYPQYWGWWLSGVATSELSSLGCHTQLWRPREQRFSDIAIRHGWASLFAPIAPAWQVLGPVRSVRSRATGLPASCLVHVGAHDSNACLARMLHGGGRMTLVSTGTWIVVMAPGANASVLDPQRDMLANVSVRGDLVPTARFMGGRELEALCAGASPALASTAGLAELMRDDVHALPCFAPQGGPFAGSAGAVLRHGTPIDAATALSPVQRASLAALYCAQLTAHLLERLDAPLPAVIEGPFAENDIYLQVLTSLLPPGSVRVSTDPVEGTARGSWLLSHWDRPADMLPGPKPVARSLLPDLPRHHRRWLDLLQQLDPNSAPAAVRRGSGRP